MKRILVPTDFSFTAENAFRFALDIATKNGGTILLYHVYIPVESTFVDNDQARKQHNAETEKELLEKLFLFKNTVLQGRTDILVSTILGRSPIVDSILAFIVREKIDFVVMGSQGASGLKKVLIGSVAARVIENSTVPLLLIPEKYNFTAPKHLVFATDYLLTDKIALTFIIQFVQWYNASMTVVHFMKNQPYLIEIEKEEREFDTYAYMLQKNFTEINVDFKLIRTSSITESMESLHDTIPYDIMAMVRRKKNFMEKFFLMSFTKNMAYVTKFPLLMFPDKS